MSPKYTFCFTDIEGSTRLLSRLGPDAYEAVQDTQRAILRDAWRTHGGTEVRSEGDGSFVAFASPTDAVAACIEAQQALHRAAWPEAAAPRIRIGLHTGEANPTTDGDFVGLAVHHAARVSDAANGGQVLLSDATATEIDALPDFAGLNELGSFRLRDMDEPVRLFLVEHPDLPRDTRLPRAPSSAVHNLPIIRTAFIGRVDEVKELSKLIAGHPLVTVLGTGGVGKTRIAIEAASGVTGSFPDGAWLVELATITDPSLVATRIASSLGIADDPSRPAAEAVVDHLRDRRVLLVIDNCEHVVGAVAELVDDILRTSENVTILATSREPLRIRGETEWRLPSLADDEARTLFGERGGLVPDDIGAPSVARICQRLDGIPLALELAAARLRTMTIDELASSLDDRFAALVGGYRTDLPRQQTLRAAIEWSYDLLGPDERALFERLSVFRVGASPVAIEAVCGDGVDVIANLGSLIDRSLVIPADDRYSMLESIHAYATERFAVSEDLDRVRERHRDWLIAHTAPQVLDDLEAEIDNIRAALEYRVDDKMLQLALNTSALWMRRGPFNEGHRVLTAALAASPEPSELRTNALGGLATIDIALGRYEDASTALDEVISFQRAHGRLEELAQAISGRAELALSLGDFDSARADLDEVRRFKIDDGGDLIGRCEYGLSHIALVEGRFEDAIDHATSAVELFERLGATSMIATAVQLLARAEHVAGRRDDALDHFTRAMDLSNEIGDRGNAAFVGWNLGTLEVSIGRLPSALAHLEESHAVATEIDDALAPLILSHVGHVMFLIGRREEGRETLDRATEELIASAHPFGLPYARILRADVELLEMQPHRAAEETRAAIAGLRALNDVGGTYSALARFAASSAMVGQYELAARIFGAVSNLGEVSGGADDPHPALLARAQTQEALGPDAYAAAYAEGAALSLDDAVALTEPPLDG